MDVLNGLDLRSRPITGLADPTGAQDAATKAYVDAHGGGGGGGGGSGGWTQIGATTNTTSGSSVAFTAIPSTYSDLMLVFEGVSHNSGSNQTLQIELSPDGATWTTALAITSSVTASATFYGSVSITGYRKGAGGVVRALNDHSADNTTVQGGSTFTWRIGAGINAIRIGVAAGGFDAGTIKLFAR